MFHIQLALGILEADCRTPVHSAADGKRRSARNFFVQGKTHRLPEGFCRRRSKREVLVVRFYGVVFPGIAIAER
jgi:hypothetical protein